MCLLLSFSLTNLKVLMLGMSGLACENPIKEVVEVWALDGWVCLWKGPSQLFALSRNWQTLGGAVPPGQQGPYFKASKYRQYKHLVNIGCYLWWRLGTWPLLPARKVKLTQRGTEREGKSAQEATLPDSGFSLQHTSRLQWCPRQPLPMDAQRRSSSKWVVFRAPGTWRTG